MERLAAYIFPVLRSIPSLPLPILHLSQASSKENHHVANQKDQDQPPADHSKYMVQRAPKSPNVP